MDTGAFAAVLLAPVVVLVALGIAVAVAMAVVLTAWGLSSIATSAITAMVSQLFCGRLPPRLLTNRRSA